jgi:hypothetical protein
MAVLLLIAAPAADAAPTTIPPGHSGASQYTETLPTAGGEKKTDAIQGGGPGGGEGGGSPPASPEQALGSENARRLEKLGPEGKAAARLAATGATGPGGARHGSRLASDGGSSPLKQIAGELTGTSGSGGMGLLLPLLILMTAVVAVAFLLIRRRPASPRE